MSGLFTNLIQKDVLLCQIISALPMQLLLFQKDYVAGVGAAAGLSQCALLRRQTRDELYWSREDGGADHGR